MLLREAKRILHANGYILESAIKGDYIKGEHGGEQFLNIPNDKIDDELARFYFAAAIIGAETAADSEYLNNWWNYRLTKTRKTQFEKTWTKLKSYLEGAPIRLYRGVILRDGAKLDLDKAGDCWSFVAKMPKNWLDRIWDEGIMKHTIHPDVDKKVILIGTTDISNCRVAYSLWLAGRFERNEWEVRIKDESKVKILSYKEV